MTSFGGLARGAVSKVGGLKMKGCSGEVAAMAAAAARTIGLIARARIRVRTSMRQKTKRKTPIFGGFVTSLIVEVVQRTDRV
jgi:hypothetical protein